MSYLSLMFVQFPPTAYIWLLIWATPNSSLSIISGDFLVKIPVESSIWMQLPLRFALFFYFRSIRRGRDRQFLCPPITNTSFSAIYTIFERVCFSELNPLKKSSLFCISSLTSFTSNLSHLNVVCENTSMKADYRMSLSPLRVKTQSGLTIAGMNLR